VYASALGRERGTRRNNCTMRTINHTPSKKNTKTINLECKCQIREWKLKVVIKKVVHFESHISNPEDRCQMCGVQIAAAHVFGM